MSAWVDQMRQLPGWVAPYALLPGTVNSALSAPFNGAEIGRPAADAAGDMLRVLDGLPVEETGSFYAYSGDKLPW